MVDMVEARKRAKSRMGTAAAPAAVQQQIPVAPSLPGESKPVLRSEAPEVPPTYFPVERPEIEQPKRTLSPL